MKWAKGGVTKEEFKARWESSENGGGITFEDIANCYESWGLGRTPRVKPILRVTYSVLVAASVTDAEDYRDEYAGKEADR